MWCLVHDKLLEICGQHVCKKKVFACCFLQTTGGNLAVGRVSPYLPEEADTASGSALYEKAGKHY